MQIPYSKLFVEKFWLLLSIHTAAPCLEDYDQVYIVHTGFLQDDSL